MALRPSSLYSHIVFGKEAKKLKLTYTEVFAFWNDELYNFQSVHSSEGRRMRWWDIQYGISVTSLILTKPKTNPPQPNAYNLALCQCKAFEATDDT